MVYTYQEYMLYGITIPIIVSVIILIIAVGLFMLLRKKKTGIFKQVAPIFGALCAYILLISLMRQSLPFIEGLPLDNNEVTTADVVLVEEVAEASSFPIYYVENIKGFQTARIIQTNRGEFYCIDSDAMNPGTYIEVSYLPYSRAILELNVISDHQALDYWEKHPNQPVIIQKTGNQETGYEGVIIASVFILITIKAFAIGYGISPIMLFLWKKDQQRKGQIIPRFFGIFEKTYTELVFLLACVYAFGVKSPIVGSVFLLTAIGYGYYFLEIVSTRVQFTGDYIIIRSISTKLSIEKKDIVMLRWEEQSRRPGKVLTVYLNRMKTLQFPLLDFVGLRDFCEWCGYSNLT